MKYKNRKLNLVLSGGGVKGIAYAGMFNSAETRRIKWLNIVGVSAGAIAGSLSGAGYTSFQMWNQLDNLDFKNIQFNKAENLQIVKEFREYVRNKRLYVYDKDIVRNFLYQNNIGEINKDGYQENFFDSEGSRNNLFANIITFGKKGCLFDGDLLEEWIYNVLAERGVKTFSDLRGGVIDRVNPKGYKVRMTGVDLNRGRIVLLPDDVSYYGIDPDGFEVAKAVRISTCVPFAFKPVVLNKKEGDKFKSFNLVDGGVLDRFPYWAVDSKPYNTVGFKLSGGEKKKFFSIDNALDILKSLISVVIDMGIPKNEKNKIEHIGLINTTKISFLDFNLSDEDKMYLYNAGRLTANLLFSKLSRGRGK
jgi:NTE family protein